jgi:hypothetical protein
MGYPGPLGGAVARSRGRANDNVIRTVHTGLRGLALVRRSRQVGLQRGLQRQRAEAWAVVPSVIGSDLRRILAADVRGGCVDGQRRGTRAGHRLLESQEKAMGFRCTVRLPDDLHERLQMAADARNCGLSDVIRLALPW